MSGKPAGVAFRVGDPGGMRSYGCNITTPLEQGVRIAIEYMQKKAVARPTPSLAPHAVPPPAPFPTPSPAPSGRAPAAKPPKLLYSAFHCQGGSQSLKNWTLQKTPTEYPEADDASVRVCLLRNVCWKSGELDYYEDPSDAAPDRAKLSAFGGSFVHPGYLSGPWAPRVVKEQVPADLEVLANATFFYSHRSYDDNFGHLLHDVIFPVITAATVLNIPLERAQILNYGCDRSDTAGGLFGPTTRNPMNGHLRVDDCRDNYRQYVLLVLGRPAIDLQLDWASKSVCLDRVVVGHARAYGLHVLDLQRAATLRKAQMLVAANAGVDLAPSRTQPERHRVMVLMKRRAWTPPTWPGLCEDVRRAVQALGNLTEVGCFDPAGMSIKEQILEALKATIVVAEHGTVSYRALYLREGACFVSIGQVGLLKEPQVLLFASHFQTYYMTVEAKAEFPKYVRLCMAAVSTRLGIDIPLGMR